VSTASGSGTTQPPRGISPFRLQCVKEVARLLREEDLPFHQEQVEGREESYSVFRVESTIRKPLKIYVYEDEAGFFAGEHWHIWETPDHDTPQGLMSAFLDGLRSTIADLSRQSPGAT